jgi:hypothetical protein
MHTISFPREGYAHFFLQVSAYYVLISVLKFTRFIAGSYHQKRNYLYKVIFISDAYKYNERFWGIFNTSTYKFTFTAFWAITLVQSMRICVNLTFKNHGGHYSSFWKIGNFVPTGKRVYLSWSVTLHTLRSHQLSAILYVYVIANECKRNSTSCLEVKKNVVSAKSELNVWSAQVQEMTGVWPKLITDIEKEDHGGLLVSRDLRTKNVTRSNSEQMTDFGMWW